MTKAKPKPVSFFLFEVIDTPKQIGRNDEYESQINALHDIMDVYGKVVKQGDVERSIGRSLGNKGQVQTAQNRRSAQNRPETSPPFFLCAEKRPFHTM